MHLVSIFRFRFSFVRHRVLRFRSACTSPALSGLIAGSMRYLRCDVLATKCSHGGANLPSLLIVVPRCDRCYARHNDRPRVTSQKCTVRPPYMFVGDFADLGIPDPAAIRVHRGAPWSPSAYAIPSGRGAVRAARTPVRSPSAPPRSLIQII